MMLQIFEIKQPVVHNLNSNIPDRIPENIRLDECWKVPSTTELRERNGIVFAANITAQRTRRKKCAIKKKSKLKTEI
jgi:hypothetical protein